MCVCVHARVGVYVRTCMHVNVKISLTIISHLQRPGMAVK